MAEPVQTGPRVRRAAIPDDARLVVRGLTSIEPETSIRQATLFQRRVPTWGHYGLSAFYARSDDEVLDLAEDRLVTITFYDEPIEAVARLMAVTHETIQNPAYRGMEAQ